MTRTYLRRLLWLALFSALPAAQPIAAQARRSGNRHPLARAEFDRGAARPETRMDRMILVLEADAERQQGLEALLAAQQDPESAEYHRWLSPAEFGERFGAAPAEIERAANWLRDRGFDVEPAPDGRRMLLFSGTAAQVKAAFRTEVRRYQVDGEWHYANARDPEMPRELTAVASGIASMHDFHSRTLHHMLPLEAISAAYTAGGTHYMAPADFATIYGVAPLYAASIDGTGQSIAVVGRSNFNLSDVQSFRSRFGLPAKAPTVIVNGRDPGIVSSDEVSEALLDVEWAGAVARNATIQFVVSASTNASDGVLLSAQYIVNHNLAPVVSLSFGSCEASLGAAGNRLFNSLWQQAAAQGMTVVVSSGDSGAAGCDSPSARTAGGGASVNGLCSTPYSTCVGGTQFLDVSNAGAYWSAGNNTATYSSATSYIPEAAWNSSGIVPGGTELWATGGGASLFYAKPAWQTGTGVPAGSHRYVPDISLNGSTHDGYLVLVNGQMYAAGGTSASAPSFAGLMALVAQKSGARQGNANPALYGLAAKQASGGAAVMHEVAGGNNSVPGLLGMNAGMGYDAVTGLGSPDANQMVTHWSGAVSATPGLQLSANPPTVSLVQGGSAAVTLTVAVTGGFNSPVTLTNSALIPGLTASYSGSSLSAPGSGSVTLTLGAGASLAAGAYKVVVTASGAGLSQAAPVSVTVVKCTYAIDPANASVPAASGSGFANVTAPAGCAWTATSGVSWIGMTNSSGSGNGKAGWSVTANTGTAARTGTLTIAGLKQTVVQAAPAVFRLTPASASFPAGGGTGGLAISAPSDKSAWTAKSNNDWITLGGGSFTGSKTLSYAVAANNAASARVGTATLAGLTLTISQAAALCTYKVTAGAGTGGTTGSVAVASPTGCGWTAISNAAWLTITSGSKGSGNGTVTYTLAANTSKNSRSAIVAVAGSALTVTQAAARP